MNKLRVLDLFSGIGGFSLGLERTGGFQTVAFCEIEDYPRRVLAKHWPDVPCYDDVRTLTADALSRDGIAVDVICGGFPCQDLSAAGKQAGMDGTRSGLWSEIARLMGELRPRFVIVENVSGLLSGPSEQPGGWFGRVLGDLAAFGYDAEWNCIPASAIGAPHRRDRVWIVAYPSEVRCDAGRAREPLQGARLVGEAFADQPMADATGERRRKARGFRRDEPEEWVSGGCEIVANAECTGLEGHDCRQLAGGSRRRSPDDIRPRGASMAVGVGQPLFRPSIAWRECNPWSFEPELGRVAHGISNRVERVEALGNAVVPQIPELIGRAILKAEGIAP
jgi:DNA (cytosine-5)-methyltransferase 1